MRLLNSLLKEIKMKNALFLILIFGLTLSACAAQPSQADTLVGTWKLLSYGDADRQVTAHQDSEPTLTFNSDGTVGGNFGCNSFGGEYKATRGDIKFGSIASTLMACFPEELMTQESETLAILSGRVDYAIVDGVLTITNSDGKVLVLEAMK